MNITILLGALSGVVLLGNPAFAQERNAGSDSVSVPLRGVLPFVCRADIEHTYSDPGRQFEVIASVRQRCNGPHALLVSLPLIPDVSPGELTFTFAGRGPDRVTSAGVVFLRTDPPFDGPQLLVITYTGRAHSVRQRIATNLRLEIIPD